MRKIEWLHAAATVLLVTFSSPDLALAQRKPPKVEPAKPKTLAEVLTEPARSEWAAGKILFDDGDFATALQKFKSAYMRQPDVRLLWNIGAAEKNLRHYVKASKIFRQYLAEAGDLATPDDRREAEALLRVIEQLTLSITIDVSEPGAEVFLDDESLGTTPLKAVLVDIGQRRFRIEKPGFRSVQSTQQVGPSHEFKFALERQRANLELTVPPTATVMIDGKPIGRGPRIVTDELPIGAHALRIDAPRMRPYQGEIVLEDGKTRSLNIDLEPDPEQFGEIRVAVGCRVPSVRTPEDGLVVFLDGSHESASALGVRKRTVDGVEVPAYVPFTVTAGRHLVHVRIPNCEPLEIEVEAAPQRAAEVNGMLAPTNEWMNGSPAGSPSGGRIAAGLTTATMHFKQIDGFFPGTQLVSRAGADLTMAGPSASGGFQGRWVTVALDGRYLVGSSEGSRLGVAPGAANIGSVSQEASFSVFDVGVRAGFRVPVHSAALGIGIGNTLGVFSVSPVAAAENSHFFIRPFAWAMVEAKPFCDFAAGFGMQLGVAGVAADRVEPREELAFVFHAAYEPNVICRRRRGGEYRLYTQASAPAAAQPEPAPAPPPPPPPPPPSAPVAIEQKESAR